MDRRFIDRVFAQESAGKTGAETVIRSGVVLYEPPDASGTGDVLEVTQERIEIVCAPGPTSQRPPSVLLDREPARVDVSLSHDVQWISWRSGEETNVVSA